MEPELILQGCRIYQNKDREIVTLPYTEARAFYRALDDLVQNGRRIRISFPEERLEGDCALLRRLTSCRNGVEFLEELLDKPAGAADILHPARTPAIRDALEQYLPGALGLYRVYEATRMEDQDGGGQYILLEPCTEGIVAVSFEVEL
jgi:hypothetical protein